MPTVSELMAGNIENMLTNMKTWGGVIYNVKAYGAKGDGVTDDTAKISDAVDKADDAGGIVFLLPGTYNINANLTIPANVTLWFANGAKLNIASGITVTINGYIEAGLHQIFSGNGTVSGNIKNPFVVPQWWGAVGDGVIDDSFVVQKALNESNGRVVVFPKSTYVLGEIVLPDRVTILGNWSTIKPKPGATFIFKAENKSWIELGEFIFQDTAVNMTSGPCILLDSVRDPRVHDIIFDDVHVGIRLRSSANPNNSTRNGRIFRITGDNIRSTGIDIGTDVHDMRYYDIFLSAKTGNTANGIHLDSSNPVVGAIGANMFDNIVVLGFNQSFLIKNGLEVWGTNIVLDTPTNNGLVMDGATRVFMTNLWAATCGDNGVKLINGSELYLNQFYGWNNTNNDLFVDTNSNIYLDDDSSYYTKRNIGTGSSIKGRRKIVTVTVPSGQTTGSTNHGLGEVPTRIHVTPTSDFGSGNRWWVQTINSTQIVIALGSAPASNVTFNVVVGT